MKTQSKKVRFMSLLAVAVALVLSLSGCGEKDDSVATDNTDIDTIEILELPFSVHQCLCNYTHYNMRNDTIMIINSQDAFDELFPECTIPLDIDFSTKSMVTAIGSCNCFEGSQATIEHGDNDDITITITVFEGFCAAIDHFFVTYTCPKITDNQNVQLVLNFERLLKGPGFSTNSQ